MDRWTLLAQEGQLKTDVSKNLLPGAKFFLSKVLGYSPFRKSLSSSEVNKSKQKSQKLFPFLKKMKINIMELYPYTLTTRACSDHPAHRSIPSQYKVYRPY